MHVFDRKEDVVPEEAFHVLLPVCDDAARPILRKENLVERKDRVERGYARLTRFWNDIPIPQGVVKKFLCFIETEEHLVPLRVLDKVQIIKTPLPIGQVVLYDVRHVLCGSVLYVLLIHYVSRLASFMMKWLCLLLREVLNLRSGGRTQVLVQVGC